MAASSSSSHAEDYVGALHAVVPLATCPHLNQVANLPEEGLDINAECKGCGIRAEAWVCLTCFEANCGRHIHEHASIHSVEKGHPMALSLTDLSVWCYPCDAYVHNERCLPHKNDAHLKKFGETAPV